MRHLAYLMVLFLLSMNTGLCALETPIRQAYDLNCSKQFVKTSLDETIVFWSDVPNGNRDIFAQKIGRGGQTIWTEPLPLVSASGDQSLLDVVSTSDSCFVILWGEYNRLNCVQLKTQKYNRQGQALWATGGIPVTGDNINLNRSFLVPNLVGGAYVVYYYYSTERVVRGQNIDASGNFLWQAGGLSLFTHSSIIDLIEAIPDNAGGLFINVSKNVQFQIQNHLLRVDASGNVTAPMTLIALSFTGGRFKVKSFNTNELLIYDLGTYSGAILRMAKIDYQGNFLTAVLEYPMPITGTIEEYELLVKQGESVSLAWMHHTANYALYVQKYDVNLVPVWQPGAVAVANSTNPIYQVSLSQMGNNLSINWLEGYSYVANLPLCKAQLLNPQGGTEWEAGGKILGAGYSFTKAISFSDRCLYLRNANVEGNLCMQYQIVNSAGVSFIANGGANIVQSMNGIAQALKVHPINNKYLSLWADTRYLQRIYYQIQNTNQQNLLPDNGIALNPTEHLSEYYITSITAPNDCVAIFYGFYSPNDSLYLQLIDQNGTKQYPGKGIAFKNFDYMNYHLSSDASGIYIGWSTNGESGAVIKGQYIVNGAKMWGDDGTVIASNPNPYTMSLVGLQSSYYIISQTDPMLLKVIMVDANGNPAPGWDVNGLDIVTGNHLYQLINNTGIVDSDLIVFLDSSEGKIVQRISPTGLRLWSDEGRCILNPNEDESIIDVVYVNPISFLYSSFSQSMTRVTFQQLDSSGFLLLEPTGPVVIDPLSNMNSVQLRAFTNGSFICAWTSFGSIMEQGDNIYLRQISPQGTLMSDTAQVFCDARYNQNSISMATLGNQAMLAWSDDRAGIISSEYAINAVWSNIYNSLPVANADPIELNAVLMNLNNYPNPFNPTTNISFTLTKRSKVDLYIYNLKGQLVKELLADSELRSGKHCVSWDGRDMHGNSVSSGIYYYSISNNETCLKRKMVLLK